jgi:hypothetical protein
MKKLLLLLTLLAAFLCTAQDAKAQAKRLNYTQWHTNTASTATPVQLYPVNMWVKKVTLLGVKTESTRTANVAVGYIGPFSTNDTQQFILPIYVAAGEITITAQPGTEFNLSEWYFDSGDNDDGITVIFQ